MCRVMLGFHCQKHSTAHTVKRVDMTRKHAKICVGTLGTDKYG